MTISEDQMQCYNCYKSGLNPCKIYHDSVKIGVIQSGDPCIHMDIISADLKSAAEGKVSTYTGIVAKILKERDI